jgi:MraZ protein
MHLRFYGNYDLKIDPKNRLVIPAEFRKLIVPEVHGTAFIVVTGMNGFPWLYPEKVYDQLTSAIPVEMTPDEDIQAYSEFMFGLADKVTWDELGRVLLPDKTLKRTGIQRDVTLAGINAHLELWNRDAWENRVDFLTKNRPSVERKGKDALEALKTKGIAQGLDE